MIFFPFATDAPIYHWPIVTVLMIVVNAAIFFITGGGGDHNADSMLVLHFDRIQPVEWLMTNFMHASASHLIGNMLFLWPFGLVVEGKVGWWRYLLIYLGIGIIYGAALQLTMNALGRDEIALGASAVLFGLLALCVTWAPKNEFKVFFLFFIGFFFRVGVWEISIMVFCGLYLALQLVQFALAGFDVSSALLHLLGFAVGFPLGLAMLKLRWVDCEGWDLLSVWSGKLHTMPDVVEIRQQSEAVNQRYMEKEEEELRQSREAALGLIKHHLDEDRPAVAYAVYVKHDRPNDGAWLPAPLLGELATAVVAQKMWAEATTLLRRMVADYPAQSAAARLKLAQILIQIENRPKQALAVLAKLPAVLNEALAKRRDQLTRLAQKEIDEGTLETLVEDW